MVETLFIVQLVGVIFLALFARGVYIIWTATEPVDEHVRREVTRRERGVDAVEVPNQYERETYTEARGRLHLYKRRLRELLDR